MRCLRLRSILQSSALPTPQTVEPVENGAAQSLRFSEPWGSEASVVALHRATPALGQIRLSRPPPSSPPGASAYPPRPDEVAAAARTVGLCMARPCVAR